jgi:hypothetical protein
MHVPPVALHISPIQSGGLVGHVFEHASQVRGVAESDLLGQPLQRPAARLGESLLGHRHPNTKDVLVQREADFPPEALREVIRA